MKLLLIITFSILYSLASFSYGKSRQKLVWADEFNGDSLDYSKWGVEENAYGGGNNEQQIYRWDKKNLRVENGNLVIEAHKDNPNVAGTTRPYSSARIRSKHRGDWKYCRVDVRAKLPIGKGMWPAIWMLPTDEKYGGWASSGEIDIMELVGHKPSTIMEHFITEVGGQKTNMLVRNSNLPKAHLRMNFTFSRFFGRKEKLFGGLMESHGKLRKNGIRKRVPFPLPSISGFIF